MILGMAMITVPRIMAQVQTIVPPVIPKRSRLPWSTSRSTAPRSKVARFERRHYCPVRNGLSESRRTRAVESVSFWNRCITAKGCIRRYESKESDPQYKAAFRPAFNLIDKLQLGEKRFERLKVSLAALNEIVDHCEKLLSVPDQTET